MMKRRAFLGLFAAAPVLLLPELIIPRKTFFLPPTGGWKETGEIWWMWNPGEFWVLGDRTTELWPPGNGWEILRYGAN